MCDMQIIQRRITMTQYELIEAVRAKLQDRTIAVVHRAIEEKHGKAHINWHTLTRLKNRTGPPRARTVRIVADYLGVDLDD